MGGCLSGRFDTVSPFLSFTASAGNSRVPSRGTNGESGGRSRGSRRSIAYTSADAGELLPSSSVKSFTLYELKSATRNFRPDSILGEGGFGSVFKGWIDENSLAPARAGTGMVIAVKKLNQDGFQGHREWLVCPFSPSRVVNDPGWMTLFVLKAELNYLGQLSHPNLVKLIGYCLEDEHRLLVYEFMPRGSLENHLFRRGTRFQPLSWNVRMKVALGAAKGLAFLHSAEVGVIYRDFKTSNILLGLDYDAKLSDFGLAKDGPSDTKSYVSTRVMGTYGYAAPDYLATGHLTTKCDVYSFGVVLLELLTGKRAIDKNRPTGEHDLVDWARPYLTNKRRILRVMDPRLNGQYSLVGAQKVAFITLRCLSSDPKHRPRMDEVVNTLEQLQESGDAMRDPRGPQQSQNRRFTYWRAFSRA